MNIHTLRSLILSAQDCDTLELFALECGGALPESFPESRSIEVLSAIYRFAHNYTFTCVRSFSGMTQARFAQEYNVPLRTIENWDSGVRTPPSYVLELLLLAELSRNH